jgi:hypothetical protein
MKFRLAVVLIAIYFLAADYAFSQSIKLTQFRGDYKYSYEISDKTVMNTPSFNPEKEEAPVSVRKAIEIARTSLIRFVPKADNKWELLRAELLRIGSGWIYKIEFYCFLEKCVETDSFTIYVKMDGTIVEPEVLLNDGKAPPIKISTN